MIFAAWILTPLAILIAALGCGLLVQSAAPSFRFGDLTIPFGLCFAILLVSFPYALGFGSPVALALLALAAGAGYVRSWRGLTEVLPDRWASFAGLAVFGLFMAPVVLSGELTFAGYSILGDTSVHLSMIDYVAQHGSHATAMPPSSYAAVVKSILDIGYPLGMHYLIATVHAAVPVDVAWSYQPVISTFIALAALPATRLLRGAGVGYRLSALAAVLVAGSYLTYSYAMQGGVKEMAIVLLALLAAVIAGETLDASEPVGHAVVFALVTATAFAVYSTGGLPWFGLIALFVLVAARAGGRSRFKRLLRTMPSALGVFVLFSLPALVKSVSFFSAGSRLLTSSSGADVGNLLGSIKFWQVFSAWLVGDFRIAPGNAWVSGALIGGIVVLVGFGIMAIARHRLFGPFCLLASTFLVWAILPAGVYIEAKFLMLMTPAVVLTAVIGLSEIRNLDRPLESFGLAAMLAAAVLASDAMVYRAIYLAPADRHAELQAIGKRFAGQGPAVYLEFDEYGKHFLRKLPVNDALEGYTPRPAETIKPRPIYAQSIDSDELTPDFLDSYRLLVLRRSPVASRPGSEFTLAARYVSYDVWRRTGRPAVAHLPLGGGDRPAESAGCLRIAAFVKRRSAGASTVTAAERPNPLALRVAAMRFPSDWIVKDEVVYPTTPGDVTGSLDVTAPGRYRFWLRGSFGRGADLIVNGRRLGHTRDVQSPGGVYTAGEIDLPRGPVHVLIRRPGGSYAPADARGEAYDTVFAQPVDGNRMRRVAIANWRELCGLSLDWIETVR